MAFGNLPEHYRRPGHLQSHAKINGIISGHRRRAPDYRAFYIQFGFLAVGHLHTHVLRKTARTPGRIVEQGYSPGIAGLHRPARELGSGAAAGRTRGNYRYGRRVGVYKAKNIPNFAHILAEGAEIVLGLNPLYLGSTGYRNERQGKQEYFMQFHSDANLTISFRRSIIAGGVFLHGIGKIYREQRKHKQPHHRNYHCHRLSGSGNGIEGSA